MNKSQLRDGYLILYSVVGYLCLIYTLLNYRLTFLPEILILLLFIMAANYFRFPLPRLRLQVSLVSPFYFLSVLILGNLSILPVFFARALTPLGRKRKKTFLSWLLAVQDPVEAVPILLLSNLIYEKLGGLPFSTWSSVPWIAFGSLVVFMTFLELFSSLAYLFLAEGKLPLKSLLQLSSIQLVDIPLAPVILPVYFFYSETALSGLLFMSPPVLVVLWFVRYFFVQFAQRQELSELLEVVDELISSTLNFREMVQRISQKMRILFKADGVDFLISKRGGMREFFLAEGESPWNASGSKDLNPGAFPDEPAVFPDIRGNPSFALYEASRLYSIVAIPVHSVEEKVGVFVCSKEIPSYFYNSHLNFSRVLGRRLGPPLLSAKLHEEILSTLEELKATQAQLVQSEKMAGLGKLAAGVAHEINNPLAAILMNSDLLTQDSGNRKALELIRHSTRRCKEIVERLLRFSRQSGTQFQTFEIEPVIREGMLLWEKELEESKIELEMEFSGKPVISGEEQEFFQVVSNLVSNARDAILQTGRTGGKICIRAREAPQGTRLEIQDNGCGMTGETRSRMFDPFFTTKEIGKGTGLGLAVSYGIISALGGKIEVESVINSGSTLILTFPPPAPATKSHLIEKGLRSI